LRLTPEEYSWQRSQQDKPNQDKTSQVKSSQVKMTILSIKTAFLAGLTCLDTGLVSRDPMVVIAHGGLDGKIPAGTAKS
jgi:hypothetical protein